MPGGQATGTAGASQLRTLSSARRPVLTMVGRSYCHLCDDMRQALLKISDVPAFTLHYSDVDTDEALLAKYDELVPVLLTAEGHTLCHYHVNEGIVREYLSRFE